ncbi:hypothetical protein Peur_007318 [Populus x canadensis]
MGLWILFGRASSFEMERGRRKGSDHQEGTRIKILEFWEPFVNLATVHFFLHFSSTGHYLRVSNEPTSVAFLPSGIGKHNQSTTRGNAINSRDLRALLVPKQSFIH